MQELATSTRQRLGSLLEKIGLHRRELRAWALYDWANSAMAATIVTAIFPTYYSRVAAEDLPAGLATQRYAIVTTLSLTIIALLAPLLGALADLKAIRKRLLAFFFAIGTSATACMFFIGHGDWLLASILFLLCNVGASGSFVFYDALLPHIARADEMDRISTAGYALGYLGGGLLLAFNLACIQYPAQFGLPAGDHLSPAEETLPVRLAFVSVALWWALFAIPLFRNVAEPPPLITPREWTTRHPLTHAFLQLRRTFRELRRYRAAVLMLLAFLIYNDGILTIIRMATIYGSEIGLKSSTMIAVVLLVNFIGVPFAFLFGQLARRIGAKRSIYAALVVFVIVSFLGYRMSSANDFLVVGILTGMVLGGTQALSRSLFASMIPKARSSEFFAFFAVMEKFAGILGPAIFALMILLTGSSRSAILSIAVFFALGGLLLKFVDVEAGRQAAAASDDAPETCRTHSHGVDD